MNLKTRRNAGSAVVVTLISLTLLCLSATSSAGQIWETVVQPLTGRSSHAMTTDLANNRIVLFGGARDSGGSSSETFLWGGAAWRLSGSDRNPPYRRYAASMAYDSRREVMVLFGGWSDGTLPILDRTWEWDGYEWRCVIPADGSPPYRTGGSMAYDSNRCKVVLFGGITNGQYVDNDLWEWDGRSWEQIIPEGDQPIPRRDCAMAYDPISRMTLIHGGYNTNHSEMRDTWTWDGLQWSLIDYIPYNSAGHSMSYDPSRKKMVMYGGEHETRTWEWDGVEWTEIETAHNPGARKNAPLAFDPVNKTVVLVGGRSLEYEVFNDMWAFDGTDWREIPNLPLSPGLRESFELAYDPSGRQIVLFGGNDDDNYFTDTWAYKNAVWTKIESTEIPFGRTSHNMTSWRDGVLMYGGRNSYASMSFKETWLFKNNQWIQQYPETSPTYSSGHCMAYDTDRDCVVLFDLDSETWVWDGTDWKLQAVPDPAPPERRYAEMIYDANRRKIVLYGDEEFSGLRDTWEWDGERWEEITTNTTPLIDGPIGFEYDLLKGRAVILEEVYLGSVHDMEIWEYDGLDWRLSYEDNEPMFASFYSSFTYDTSSQSIILFEGNNKNRTIALRSAVQVDISVNQDIFYPGDPFALTLTLDNASFAQQQIIFVAMEAAGGFWFWPSWAAYPSGIDYEIRTAAPGITEETLLAFTWPETGSSMNNLLFHAALADPDGTVRSYDFCVFGFSE